jgi:predicted ATPase
LAKSKRATEPKETAVLEPVETAEVKTSAKVVKSVSVRFLVTLASPDGCWVKGSQTSIDESWAKQLEKDGVVEIMK